MPCTAQANRRHRVLHIKSEKLLCPIENRRSNGKWSSRVRKSHGDHRTAHMHAVNVHITRLHSAGQYAVIVWRMYGHILENAHPVLHLLKQSNTSLHQSPANIERIIQKHKVRSAGANDWQKVTAENLQNHHVHRGAHIRCVQRWRRRWRRR